MQRLGKDVVDLLDVTVKFGEKTVLNDVTWRIAPGERTGILGVNGAGKSTLLSLVAGTLQPTVGRVKRGKTIKVAMLTQQLVELDDIHDDRVSEVIGRQKSSYVTGGKEMTPGQMLERVGFMSAQLTTQVKDLSGGQKRRLQLLLILLDEPNVLILDEPTNDLDTDMLAAIEDLLDSFPGTLLVVSHDRYLLERVTDNQYAVTDGAFRHLPGGVEQYLGPRGPPAPRRQARHRRGRPAQRAEGARLQRSEGRQAAGANRGAARETRRARPVGLRGSWHARHRAGAARGIRGRTGNPLARTLGTDRRLGTAAGGVTAAKWRPRRGCCDAV